MKRHELWVSASIIFVAGSVGCTVQTEDLSSPRTAATTPSEAWPSGSSCTNVFGASCGSDASSGDHAVLTALEAGCRSTSLELKIEKKITPTGEKVKVVHASFEEQCVEGPATALPPAAPPTVSAEPTAPTPVDGVLSAIHYRDCGAGGVGSVDVIFVQTGSVGTVVVHGAFEAKVKACIAQRFAAAQLPPFDGPPQVVHWPVDLDGWGG